MEEKVSIVRAIINDIHYWIPSALIAVCLLYMLGRFIVVEKKPKNTLLIRQIPSIIAPVYPSPWVYRYQTHIGEKLAPIGFISFIEVTNISEVNTRIISYELNLKINKKWIKIPSLTISAPLNIFLAADGNIKNCTQFDFRKNSFDLNAMTLEIKKGESISGWVFFEWPKDVREILNKDVKVEMYRYTLVDKQERVSEVESSFRNPPEGSSQIDGGMMVVYQVNGVIQRQDLSTLQILPYYEFIEFSRKAL